jgi:hypothetical protein
VSRVSLTNGGQHVHRHEVDPLVSVAGSALDAQPRDDARGVSVPASVDAVHLVLVGGPLKDTILLFFFWLYVVMALVEFLVLAFLDFPLMRVPLPRWRVALNVVINGVWAFVLWYALYVWQASP